MSDLALSLQILQRPNLIFSRYFGIDTVELEQVDPLETQAAQTAFARSSQMFWPAVLDPLIRSRTIEAGFGCDY